MRQPRVILKRHYELNLFLAAPFGEDDGYDGNEMSTGMQNSDDEQMLSDNEGDPRFGNPGSEPHSPAGSPLGSPQSMGNSTPASPLGSPSSSHHSSGEKLKQYK